MDEDYAQYHHWDNEEFVVDNHHKLQWKTDPIHGWQVRLIEWCSSSCETEDIWVADECEIQVLANMEVHYDGVRHCWMGDKNNYGYIYYPNPEVMAEGFKRIDELCEEWGCYK